MFQYDGLKWWPVNRNCEMPQNKCEQAASRFL